MGSVYKYPASMEVTDPMFPNNPDLFLLELSFQIWTGSSDFCAFLSYRMTTHDILKYLKSFKSSQTSCVLKCEEFSLSFWHVSWFVDRPPVKFHKWSVSLETDVIYGPRKLPAALMGEQGDIWKMALLRTGFIDIRFSLHSRWVKTF